MTQLDYIAHLRADGEAFVQAVEHGPLDAPVVACPDWDLAKLARHMGDVHRWAAEAARTAAQPVRGSYQYKPPEGVDMATWLREGLSALVEVLDGLDPEAPTWHVFPVPMVAAVWPRRQANETAMHRWDAQTAVGLPATLDPVLSSDGIDEYFAVTLPRLVQREGVSLPTGTLHIHCTDVAGEWLIRSDGGALDVERIHAKGDAALRGTAEALLLHLWARPAEALETIGDADVAAQWLSLGGM